MLERRRTCCSGLYKGHEMLQMHMPSKFYTILQLLQQQQNPILFLTSPQSAVLLVYLEIFMKLMSVSQIKCTMLIPFILYLTSTFNLNIQNAKQIVTC